MGSVVLNHRSDQIDTSYNMLGGTINPSESVHRPPSHTAQHLESASSRSASSNTTPTSTTAPPFTFDSSANPPRHVPTYINSSHPSSRSSSTTPASYAQTPAASMISSASGRAPPADYSSYPTSQSAQSFQNVNQGPSEPTAYASQTGSQSSPPSPRLHPTFRSMHSLGGSEASSPSRIKVRDLSHIQSFASEEMMAPQRSQTQLPQDRHFEISSMPVTDIIEMVAGLLTKITATNDVHHEQVHRHIPPPDGTANLSPQDTSVLAFHGKNVPSITILSYLTRIHKYCPTTYEVFLSLLVYFDRMTELVNKGHLSRLRSAWDNPASIQTDNSGRSESEGQHEASPMVTPPSSANMRAQEPHPPTSSISPSLHPQDEDDALSRFFVVDSFNIHRLVIAGVTCASKFFSDVFYTNSRYAKVGGLPLVELNHLELQFLLLNDFRLSIPVEELEAYGTMLVEFYAREIIAQQQQQPSRQFTPAPDSQMEGGVYMRTRDDHPQPEIHQTPTPP